MSRASGLNRCDGGVKSLWPLAPPERGDLLPDTIFEGYRLDPGGWTNRCRFRDTASGSAGTVRLAGAGSDAAGQNQCNNPVKKGHDALRRPSQRGLQR